MKKFEYYETIFVNFKPLQIKEFESNIRIQKSLGLKGWELVSVISVSQDNSMHKYIYRREIIDG